jgi:hypothetical protein
VEQSFWRKCSQCKKPIGLRAKYYECSVSTCTGSRTGYVFCSVPCWEVHVPGARHRDASAIENTAGTTPWVPPGTTASTPTPASSAATISTGGAQRRIVPARVAPASPVSAEVLVVVSKIKDYIRARADMNTADDVKEVLSEHLRDLCDGAIDSARQDGRKTVMKRDFRARPR